MRVNLIAVQLRSLASHLEDFEDGETGEPTNDDKLVLAAADEIERLEAIINYHASRNGLAADVLREVEGVGRQE